MFEEYITTLNKMGYATRSLDFIQENFICYAQNNASGLFFDIGCAFGNTIIPLVKNNINVIGVDLCQGHIDAIHEKLSQKEKILFQGVVGHFPHEINFPAEKFDAVNMSMVLHFFPEQDVVPLFQKIAHILKPGGFFFMTTSTPYQGVLSDFLPLYEKRRREEKMFPGVIENLGMYIGARSKDLPDYTIVYTTPDLVALCKKSQLTVVETGYFPRVNMPQDITKDGREYAFLIAKKKLY